MFFSGKFGEALSLGRCFRLPVVTPILVDWAVVGGNAFLGICYQVNQSMQINKEIETLFPLPYGRACLRILHPKK